MRAPRAAPRGMTILEAVVAMAVLLIGVTGVMGLHTTGLRLNDDARKLTRATAIADDLLHAIDLWRYDDPRLANAIPANDGDVADAAGAFESGPTPAADHGEADLALGAFDGVTQPELTDGNPFERYWDVAYPDDLDGDGVPDAVRIAVVVRWPTPAGQTDRWRRIVLHAVKLNPAELP
jgi:type II secretory pathway pseudopilin PulG